MRDKEWQRIWEHSKIGLSSSPLPLSAINLLPHFSYPSKCYVIYGWSLKSWKCVPEGKEKKKMTLWYRIKCDYIYLYCRNPNLQATWTHCCWNRNSILQFVNDFFGSFYFLWFACPIHKNYFNMTPSCLFSTDVLRELNAKVPHAHMSTKLLLHNSTVTLQK